MAVLDRYVSGSWYPKAYKGKSEWYQVKTKAKKPPALDEKEKTEALYRLAKNGF